jgi:uncharacterized phage-associated protein
MANVFDVAQFILSRRGPMSAMKLQKLVYYSQAWSTVWDDDCLFPEEVEAWRNGPVVRELWEAHQGAFRVHSIKQGDPARLNGEQCDTIKQVLAFYGDKDAQWLSDLTHMEDPWKNAWANGQNTEITLESMSEYYSSIEPPGGK